MDDQRHQTGDADPGVPTDSLPGGTPSAGRYRILRALEEGGMGEVFLALDADLNREVILKRPKERFASQDLYRRRFLREIRVGALLEHPGIAPVYDVGQGADGGLFGVMRFVPEGSLHRLVRDYHRDHPSAVGEVPFRALLGHFAAACRAIDYAHSREVYHLDIKPRNVVTGRFGETQVIDWGLAWIKGDGIRQRVGDGSAALSGAGSGSHSDRPEGADPSAPRGFHGTRAYASPEQWEEAWEEIGPASDVYGLGATLHEILAGVPPFHADPTIPREDVLAGHLHTRPKGWMPPALAAIAGKAMAVDPRRRYASAGALADDVERFLADEPVEAYPDPWHARARRWARRHRATVAAAAALLATSAVALGVGYMAVSRQRDRAVVAEARARTERDVALRNARTARRVIQELDVEIADDFWATIPATEDRRAMMMEKAVAHYRQLLADHPDDPEIASEAAQALRRLANLLRTVGRAGDALALHDEASALLERAPDGDQSVWRDRVDAAVDGAATLAVLGEPAAALRAREAALALAVDFRGRFPEVALARLAEARAGAELAPSLRAAGRAEEAADLFARAIDAFATLVVAPSASREELLMAAVAGAEGARSLRETGRIDAARRAAAAALGWTEALLRIDAADANHRLLRGVALREEWLAAESGSEATAAESLGLLEGVVAEHPRAVGFRDALVETLLTAAERELRDGAVAAAGTHAARAETLLGPDEDDGRGAMRFAALLLQARAARAAGDDAAVAAARRRAMELIQARGDAAEAAAWRRILAAEEE